MTRLVTHVTHFWACNYYTIKIGHFGSICELKLYIQYFYLKMCNMCNMCNKVHNSLYEC